VESFARSCAHQTSPTLSGLKIGDLSNLTSRSVFPLSVSPTYVVVTDVETLQKHDSVHAVQDALARISHEQTVQPGLSGFSEASQQVLIEALPSVLVLHLKRFLYDNATNGIFKISKSVQFGPELEIPPGTNFPSIPSC
jgi:hypothetical protein